MKREINICLQNDAVKCKNVDNLCCNVKTCFIVRLTIDIYLKTYIYVQTKLTAP